MENDSGAVLVGQDRSYGVKARSVVVVDDHRAVAELLVLALKTQPGLSCVGLAHDLVTARGLLTRTQPDVVVSDIHFGAESAEDGIDFAAEITAAHPDTAVVLLTGRPERADLARVSASGACALVAKEGALDVLLQAIMTARPGGLSIDRRLLPSLVPSQRTASVELTTREGTVLEMLACGLDAATIARRLGIRTSTSRGYIKTLLAKLGAHSQLEAVVKAQRLGLVNHRDAW